MPDGTVKTTEVRARALNCPHCARKFAYPQYLTQHLIAFHSGDTPEDCHNTLKELCEESSQHLLVCPSLAALRRECGLPIGSEEALVSDRLPVFLSRLFGLAPVQVAPDNHPDERAPFLPVDSLYSQARDTSDSMFSRAQLPSTVESLLVDECDPSPPLRRFRHEQAHVSVSLVTLDPGSGEELGTSAPAPSRSEGSGQP